MLFRSVSEGINDSGDAISEAKKLLGEYAEVVKKLNFNDLKSIKTDSLKSMFNDIKEKANEIKGFPEGFKSNLESLQKNITDLVYNVQNVLTVMYTAPVELRGGYGKTSLSIGIDSLKYKRINDTIGVFMDAHADFQLPFSVSKEEGVTKVGFIGKDIPLKGSGLSRIQLNTGNGEYRKYPILENKAWLVLHKDSYLEFDCNGFKEMFLKGEFEFSRDRKSVV